MNCCNCDRTIFEKHKELINSYFENDGKKLYTMIDKILFKLKFDVDKSDFYSMGNEIFITTLNQFDEAQDFNGFLYSCLEKKFKTEMTRRTRDKRCTKVEIVEKDKYGNDVVKKIIISDVRLDAPISDEDETTYGDTIADSNTVETQIFRDEELKEEVERFLNSLSPLQKKIALLLSDNNTPDEICRELHITMKHFDNSLKRILADEKIRPLRPLVERM